MHLPMNDAPPRAIAFAKHLSKRYGFCGEIMVTAFCIYAQIDEGLSCDDDLYRVTDERRCDSEFAQKVEG